MSETSKTAYFCPDVPEDFYIISKVCQELGITAVNTPVVEPAFSMHFNDITTKEPPVPQVSGHLINGDCLDISKTKVDQVFGKVFGYSIIVDPETCTEPYVAKSDRNAAHDGQILFGPTSKKAGVVYQRLIDTEESTGLVKDLRVPIIGDRIPFSYNKFRASSNRFSNENSAVSVASAKDIFSPTEQGLLLRFCSEMNLEFGELDVLRDRKDGRIYVVDVADTPAGPPNHISRDDYVIAVAGLANAFHNQFIRG